MEKGGESVSALVRGLRESVGKHGARGPSWELEGDGGRSVICAHLFSMLCGRVVVCYPPPPPFSLSALRYEYTDEKKATRLVREVAPSL